jgi:hypothetical protein
MVLLDKNQTLQPPEGYTLRAVAADGAYLRATYDKTLRPHVVSKVVVYLNDQGREVARSIDETDYSAFAPKPEPPPAPRRFRFRNGFLIALQGLQEMLKCLSKS